jgi:hypothetical protein
MQDSCITIEKTWRRINGLPVKLSAQENSESIGELTKISDSSQNFH